MSQDDPLISTQLHRFQRFLHHLGYEVEMNILEEFWSQSQETYGKSQTFQPCSFICFHCCIHQKEITKVKKSRASSHRHRCGHNCSSSGMNHFHKTGVSKMCTLNKPNQPLSSSDHPLATVCGLIYDPMDPDQPTLNKWLDNLESIHGTCTKSDDEEESATSSSSDSSDSDSSDDSDEDTNDSDTSEDGDHNANHNLNHHQPSQQPTKRRKITPALRPISPPKPVIISPSRNHHYTNHPIPLSYHAAKAQLSQQRMDNWKRSEQERELLRQRYLHRANALSRQHSLLDMQIHRMQLKVDQRLENAIRRMDEVIREQNDMKQEQERELRMRKQMLGVINQKMKLHNITAFRLDYEHHDVISFDGGMVASNAVGTGRNKKRRSRRNRRRSNNANHAPLDGSGSEETNAKVSERDLEDVIRNQIRRAKTGWMFFSTFNTKRLAQGDPGLTGNERLKMSGKLWARLEDKDKKKWEEMEANEKEERKQIVEEFKVHGNLSKVPIKWIKKRMSPSKRQNAKDEKSEDGEDIEIVTKNGTLALPNLNIYNSPSQVTQPESENIRRNGKNKNKRSLESVCNGASSSSHDGNVRKKRKLRR